MCSLQQGKGKSGQVCPALPFSLLAEMHLQAADRALPRSAWAAPAQACPYCGMGESGWLARLLPAKKTRKGNKEISNAQPEKQDKKQGHRCGRLGSHPSGACWLSPCAASSHAPVFSMLRGRAFLGSWPGFVNTASLNTAKHSRGRRDSCPRG